MKFLSRLLGGALCALLVPAAFAAFPSAVAVYQFDGDLSEETGSGASLAYLGDAAGKSTFEADTIGGASASVLEYTNYGLDSGINVLANLAANGASTATRVNQYTVAMDVSFNTPEAGWFSILENNRPGNDAELWINATDGAIGGGTANNYFYHRTPPATVGQWMRLVLTVDLATTTAKIYIDGQLQGKFRPDSDRVAAGLDNSRLALTAGAGGNFMIFGSNSYAGNNGQGRINSLAVWDQALSADDVERLGSATADGIVPGDIPDRTKVLVKDSTFWQKQYYHWETPYCDPVGNGDVTQRWAVNGLEIGSASVVNYAGGTGALHMRHHSAHWDHPWIELNTSSYLPLASDMEISADCLPVFNPAYNRQAITMLMCDAAPGNVNMGDNYSNAELGVRIIQVGETLYEQSLIASDVTAAALGSVTPTPISGVTVSTLAGFRITITHHDGNYFAYYTIEGDPEPHSFSNIGDGGVPYARSKSVMRLYQERLYDDGGGANWDAYIDQVRVYEGYSTVPVELSDFTLE